MPNLIDRFVSIFNPVAGVRRHAAREVLTRAYEGASQRDGWRPRRPGASAPRCASASTSLPRSSAQ